MEKLSQNQKKMLLPAMTKTLKETLQESVGMDHHLPRVSGLYSHTAKPKEGRQKTQETKHGLLRELPKNAPLQGRFGSLWMTEGEAPNLARSEECEVFRP